LIHFYKSRNNVVVIRECRGGRPTRRATNASWSGRAQATYYHTQNRHWFVDYPSGHYCVHTWLHPTNLRQSIPVLLQGPHGQRCNVCSEIASTAATGPANERVLLSIPHGRFSALLVLLHHLLVCVACDPGVDPSGPLRCASLCLLLPHPTRHTRPKLVVGSKDAHQFC